MTSIYLIGSLKHDRVPLVAEQLREAGHEVFDDWHASGPNADQNWQNYETFRGKRFTEALASPFAQHAFQFDKRHIGFADVGVLCFPAGKSGHLELGYMAGLGKRTFILFEKEPESWDLMYLFADAVCYTVEDLLGRL